MNLFERMMRHQMRRQALYGRRRRGGYGYGWGRPRRRTHVRVGGCCLPIPLALVTGGALAAPLAAGRRRG